MERNRELHEKIDEIFSGASIDKPGKIVFIKNSEKYNYDLFSGKEESLSSEFTSGVDKAKFPVKKTRFEQRFYVQKSNKEAV